MPIFEYRCQECGHLEEVLQKHSDPAPESCSSCNRQKTMVKELSLTSFQLKGGGWYKDLYSSAKPSSGPEKGEKSTTQATEGSSASISSSSSSNAASSPASSSSSTSSSSSSTSSGGSSSQAA